MARPLPMPHRDDQNDGEWMIMPEAVVHSVASVGITYVKAVKPKRIGFLTAKSKPRRKGKGKR